MLKGKKLDHTKQNKKEFLANSCFSGSLTGSIATGHVQITRCCLNVFRNGHQGRIDVSSLLSILVQIHRLYSFQFEVQSSPFNSWELHYVEVSSSRTKIFMKISHLESLQSHWTSKWTILGQRDQFSISVYTKNKSDRIMFLIFFWCIFYLPKAYTINCI